MFMGDRSKLENPEETQMETGRSYSETPHRQEPHLKIKLGTLKLSVANATHFNTMLDCLSAVY